MYSFLPIHFSLSQSCFNSAAMALLDQYWHIKQLCYDSYFILIDFIRIK